MTNLVCPTHNKPLKEGKFGPFCPTLIAKNADGSKIWCNYKPAPQATGNSATPQEFEQSLQAQPQAPKDDQPKPNWDEIKKAERESMFRMSALKAASEVVAAYLGRPDAKLPTNITELLLEVSNRSLLWLKGITTVENLTDEELEKIASNIDEEKD